MNKLVFWIVFSLLSLETALFKINADTVTLKNGEKFEGKILGENAVELTLEVKIAAGIIDQKVIPKDQIEKIDKITPDELAYQEVRKLKLSANSLNVLAYEPAVQSLQHFVEKYPNSPHISEVQQNLEEFQKEKSRVDVGDFKLNNKWLSREEVVKRKYQIEAELLLVSMKASANRSDFVGALNTFELLQKDYPGSSAYPDAVEVALDALTKLGPYVDENINRLAHGKKERAEQKKLTSAAEKIRIDAAEKLEEQQDNAAMDAARSLKWKPLIIRSEKSLQSLKSLILPERDRLSKLPLKKMRASIQAGEKANEELVANNLTSAETLTMEARTLWSANETVARLQAEIARIKKEASLLKKEKSKSK